MIDIELIYVNQYDIGAIHGEKMDWGDKISKNPPGPDH